jgi:CBS domain-containing protein
MWLTQRSKGEELMIVKNILQGKPRGQGVVTVSPSASIAEAAKLLATHRIGALIAVDANGGIAGILSERDIVRGLSEAADGCLKRNVRDLMTAEVFICSESDTVDSLMKTMTAKRIRHLPVIDDKNQLAGIVTIGDAVKSRLEHADMEVDNLRHYVSASR